MPGLRRTKGAIIKISVRDRITGTNVLEKSEFSTDDIVRAKEGLKMLNEKWGVPRKIFKEIGEGCFDNDEYNRVKRMMRESISRDNEKVKKAFLS